MIDKVECLTFEAQLFMFTQGKPFRDIKIAPREIGTAHSVPSEIAELAILRIVAASASARFWGPPPRRTRSGLSHCTVPDGVTPAIG